METDSTVWLANLAEAAARTSGTNIACGGRLVGRSTSYLVIADATGSVEVDSPASTPSAPLGTWIRVSGLWNGHRITDATLRRSTAPSVDFPPPSGEWAWFHADERRRARILVQRACLLRSLRRFLERRGHLEVQTPLFVRSPGTEVHLDAFEVSRPAGFLITSPELQMKRLLAAGFPRIFQLGPCFRRDEVGTHHEPEFTMLEWYCAFASADEMMEDTEQLVSAAAADLRATADPERSNPEDATSAINFDPPWERMTVAEAFHRHANEDAFSLVREPDRFFQILADTVQPQLGTTRPTFLIEWPAELASLARLKPGQPEVADRFEAYVQGIELCNGFGELVDAAEQRRRAEAELETRNTLGKPAYPLDERFLCALEEGLPECSGNALGVDRLLFILSEAASLDEVIAFGHARR